MQKRLQGPAALSRARAQQLHLDRLSRERNELVRACVVRDLEGVGVHLLWKPGLDALRRILAATQNYYPEIVDKCYLVNTPWLFSALWRVGQWRV